MSIVDELVACYRTENGRVNPWFTRRFQDQPSEVQQVIREKLAKRGVTFDDWLSEDEWDWLAEEILNRVGERVSKSWVQMANEICAKRVPPLGKRITARNIEPLIDRMTAIRDSGRRARARIRTLENELAQRPSKEEILGNLTNEEILGRFGARVMMLIVDAAVACGDCPLSNTDPESQDHTA